MTELNLNVGPPTLVDLKFEDVKLEWMGFKIYGSDYLHVDPMVEF